MATITTDGRTRIAYIPAIPHTSEAAADAERALATGGTITGDTFYEADSGCTLALPPAAQARLAQLKHHTRVDWPTPPTTTLVDRLDIIGYGESHQGGG